MSDLLWYRGRTNKATFQAKQDGAALNLTGASVLFSAKIDTASTFTYFTKTLGNGITLSNTVSGIGVITVNPSDSSSIANVKTILQYELQTTLSTGELYVLDVGKIFLMPIIVT